MVEKVKMYHRSGDVVEMFEVDANQLMVDESRREAEGKKREWSDMPFPPLAAPKTAASDAKAATAQPDVPGASKK